MKRLVMLTGDREERAIKIGNEVGVYEVNANLLPDQKLKRAEELKAIVTERHEEEQKWAEANPDKAAQMKDWFNSSWSFFNH